MSDLSTLQPENTLRLEDFEYALPPELIAQEPLAERTQSRLLHLNKESGEIAHHAFSEIGDLLLPGDTLVLNDTRVIPARLIARRKSGGMIKLLLLKPEVGSPGLWQALVTPIKRLKPGEKLDVTTGSGNVFTIEVVDIAVGFDGFKRLVVNLGSGENMWRLLDQAGYAPLPPYIQRSYARDFDHNTSLCSGGSEDAPLMHDGADVALEAKRSTKDAARSFDLTRYQTVFAREPGAVAAPTAGLHFSEVLLNALPKRGIDLQYVTLHVGAGTFKPISTTLDEHKVEPETFNISDATAAALNKAKKESRRIIAVGTTSLRALETAGASGEISAIDQGVTHLYVKPGYQFKVADGLLTNFHLSQSSLLVLVAAFAGREKIMHAYEEAIAERYRFYSYGDAMLIL